MSVRNIDIIRKLQTLPPDALFDIAIFDVTEDADNPRDNAIEVSLSPGGTVVISKTKEHVD